ncbi:Hypothetical predicted protein [Mytilus galloprovincialis]|uniref:AIG1-type G domain-containing protein n=1 Tax=Mytilus galloprovincialis TaxID=29158 RepID=A0A8B6GWG7_MYTGA|nr:Hypothetical predicted protein [Mytilus galloprovincialis]
MPFFGKPAPPNELRFVMIGKTGVGKSRVGNTILGEKAFLFATDSKSCTKECRLESAQRFGKKIDVVDTPGVFDTENDLTTTQKEISRCIGMTAPGPHAILFCVPMGRITDQEMDVLEHYKKYFGPSLLNYLVFIFTHKDSWKESYEDRKEKVPSDELYIKSLPKKFQSYFDRSKKRYICLNNRAPNDEKDETVKRLIGNVEHMLSENGNACYTDTNHAEAEKILQDTMKVDSIRDEIKQSMSFINKLQLRFKLFFSELSLRIRGISVLEKEPASVN